MKTADSVSFSPEIEWQKITLGVIFLLGLILFCPDRSPAQLDPTFGTGGVATSAEAGPPVGSFVLSDGKILVATKTSFVRFNADGTLDSSYGPNGAVQLAIPYIGQTHTITAAARQTDGKIVLVGFDNGDGLVMRFNENGTLDTSFAGGGIHRPNLAIGFNDQLQAVLIQPDGKIVAAGYASSVTGAYSSTLIRYNPNGTLDPGFGGDGFMLYPAASYQFFPMKLLRQSDGKLILMGKDNYDGPTGFARRINADGSIDSTYPLINFTNEAFYSATLQPDDKLVVAGRIAKTTSWGRGHKDVLVSRYTTAGALDAAFGTGGQTSFDVTSFLDDAPNAVAVRPDGQILVSTTTFIPSNRSSRHGVTLGLARLSADGTTVTGKFLETNSGGFYWSLLTVLGDGKILTTHYNTYASESILLTRAVDVPVESYRFKATPFDFVYGPDDSKAKAEPTIFRPSDRKWYPNQVFPGYFFGLADDIPVPADYLGNYYSQLAMFRPSNGTWYIARSYFNAASNYVSVPWGMTGDVPAPADFDGDSRTDIAVFRPSNGVWYIRNSADDSYRFVQWGINGDKPAPGDFDGDGAADVAVWRPSDGVWYILKSSNGQPSFIHFGSTGDIPVQEDYDGDGKTDIAVWRPSTGVWYILKSSDGNFIYLQWGLASDVPVPADYDGDLKTDFAVWRPSTARWYIYYSADNSNAQFPWGLVGDVPVEGKN
ncbi:MAG: VCBS repeat-containing protein [Acidobacteria bacterium]|nr:VCBS repeat-containing protein [Acidobacteriota bacterium]